MAKPMPTTNRSFALFLGGHDLEMVEIGRLLVGRQDVAVFDRKLQWGAKASAYLDDIMHALPTAAALC